ncbi:MAG TPA: FtsQ-type POTRA domain-containing protein [Methylomusa anaerophila]|uniref:Cell division protein FtsQ n=1 Tax=Methylomusa anaerophila TaxID=1930071 RepID=A0A348AQB0_9FIRM|nr:FtsQ-type POTRA domain-containing protein [Methylomusa anaerophila]BBB93258.1 cell division protein FtsQ [Methylomusa anaerophila]HML86910.1 FtsQ-type POTRA domain-containing protein [Methylomusa anaerophila]
MQTAERLKAAKDRRRVVLAVWLAIFAVLITIFLFINSSYFFVGVVQVEGSKYIASEEVLRIANIPERVNIFRLNTAEIKNRLVNDLRIAEADVNRRFPATVVISIKERQPLAFVASQYGFVEIDKQGIVLAALKNLKQTKAPIITGIRLGNVYVGDQVSTGELQSVLTYLTALDEETLNQLSEVNIKSANELIVYTVSATSIRLGSPDRLVDKAKLTGDILREIKEKKLIVEYVDLNYTSPIIKMRE